MKPRATVLLTTARSRYAVKTTGRLKCNPTTVAQSHKRKDRGEAAEAQNKMARVTLLMEVV
jgi:hypothetical protein